jgi:MATE family multidrug resistance protein
VLENTPVNETTASRPSRLADLLHLAWPIVVARSAQVVVGFSDAVMVGTLGEEALAATTTGAFNAFFVFILPMGTAYIVSSFSAQLFGKGKVEAARRYGWYGLGLALATQVLIFASVPFVDDALALLSFAPRVTELMASYLVVRLFSGGAAVGLEAIGNFYYGLGNTRLPMLAQLLAMVLNVFLNWVLIFGNLGAPTLGVVGAAWASVLATSIAFVSLFAAFVLRVGLPTQGDAAPEAGVPTDDDEGPVPAVEGEGLPELDADEDAPLNLGEMLGMLRFGLPSGMNWFLEFAAFNVFINIVIGGLGTTALAAMNAVIQLNSVSFMPAFGVASAGAILVGQHIGRGDKDHARRAVFLTLGTTGTWQGAVGVLYLVAPALLMRAFASEDNEAFLKLGARMLMLSAIWQLFDAAANSLAEALRAAGDTTFTMWARVIIAWAVFVPGSYLSVRVWGQGEVAAVLWLAGYLGLLALVLGWRFRSGRWLQISLFGDR